MPPNFSGDSFTIFGEELENPFSSDTASVQRKIRLINSSKNSTKKPSALSREALTSCWCPVNLPRHWYPFKLLDGEEGNCLVQEYNAKTPARDVILAQSTI